MISGTAWAVVNNKDGSVVDIRVDPEAARLAALYHGRIVGTGYSVKQIWFSNVNPNQ
jgi:hypothetical protein